LPGESVADVEHTMAQIVSPKNAVHEKLIAVWLM
jgi:hypothetical protein